MKKLLALALALVTLLALVSCNSNPPEDNPGGNQTPALSRGTIQGNVYTSEYLGLSFNKPDSWVYSTDEEIADAMNLGAEMLLGENFKNVLEDSGTVYDMMVVDVLTSSSINIGFENLAKTYSSNITVDQYIQALKTQFESITSISVTFPETAETKKLGQTEFTKLECSVTTQGVSMKQVYYLRKVDKYMSFIIVTIPSGYTVAEIEAMFQ